MSLFTGPAGAWIAAREAEATASRNFSAFIFGGHEEDEGTEHAGILPGRDAADFTFDLSDWEGVSLEFTGYQGEPPTAAEAEAIFALGFTVLRIDYKDRARWTKSHGFHGDWSQVRGRAPRLGTPWRVNVDRCPTHWYGNGPDGQPESGQCARLFGHGGPHNHGADVKRGAEARV